MGLQALFRVKAAASAPPWTFASEKSRKTFGIGMLAGIRLSLKPQPWVPQEAYILSINRW